MNQFYKIQFRKQIIFSDNIGGWAKMIKLLRGICNYLKQIGMIKGISLFEFVNFFQCVHFILKLDLYCEYKFSLLIMLEESNFTEAFIDQFF